MSTEDSTETDEPRHPYETEDSFHPMGKEWEEDMRAELEDTDYDADLGMQMARDAQRLVAGELTEEEFYAEYHDDVKEEFETDERPIFDDLDGVDMDDFEDESLLESLADVDLKGDEASRRDMMSKMGAAGLFLGYSAFATYDNDGDEGVPEQVSEIRAADEDTREHRWGMTIDLERCDGCLACVTGCIDENGTSTGANWMYVFAYDNEQSDGENENFLVRPCQHCSNAPCAKVCPVRARHTREKDGLVLTNYETCIGCRYCQVACPYGVNYFQWGDPDVDMNRITHTDLTPEEVRELDPGEGFESRSAVYAEEGSERHERLSEDNDHAYDARGWWVDSRPPIGTMGKCTMCPSRQDNQTENPKGTVACQDACDSQGMSAIHFGDLDAEVGDDYDRAVRYLEERQTKSDDSDRTNKFDFRDTFEFGDGDVTVDDGYYSLHLVQRREGQADWREVDSTDIVIAGTPMEESADFAGSSIGSFGTVPSASLQVLYTDEDQDVPTTLVFDGDLDEGETLDVTTSLRLGSDGGTIASEEITVSEEGEELDVTFTVEDGAIDRGDGTHILYLVVESDGADASAAAHVPTYVSTGRPNVDTPDPSYAGITGQNGSLSGVPEVLFRGGEADIDATITYPQASEDITVDIGLVVFDGTSEQTLANIDYVYEEDFNSNTAWDSSLSTFKLLEDIGTEPNITYIGNEPGPRAEQLPGEEHPVQYADLSGQNRWGVEVKDNRKEHLDYGAGGPSEEEDE